MATVNDDQMPLYDVLVNGFNKIVNKQLEKSSFQPPCDIKNAIAYGNNCVTDLEKCSPGLISLNKTARKTDLTATAGSSSSTSVKRKRESIDSSDPVRFSAKNSHLEEQLDDAIHILQNHTESRGLSSTSFQYSTSDIVSLYIQRKESFRGANDSVGCVTNTHRAHSDTPTDSSDPSDEHSLYNEDEDSNDLSTLVDQAIEQGHANSVVCGGMRNQDLDEALNELATLSVFRLETDVPETEHSTLDMAIEAIMLIEKQVKDRFLSHAPRRI